MQQRGQDDQEQPEEEPVRRRSGEPDTYTIEGGRPPAEPEPISPVSHARRNLVIGGAAVIIAAGVAVGVTLAGGSKPAPVAAAKPADILLAGSLQVPFLGTDLFAPQAQDPSDTGTPGVGDICVTLGGYTDISQGAAVTIGDQTGKTVAVGALDPGAVETETGTQDTAACVFTFESLPVDPAKLAAALELFRDRVPGRGEDDPAATRDTLVIELRALGLMRDGMPKREYRQRLDAVLEEFGITAQRV